MARLLGRQVPPDPAIGTPRAGRTTLDSQRGVKMRQQRFAQTGGMHDGQQLLAIKRCERRKISMQSEEVIQIGDAIAARLDRAESVALLVIRSIAKWWHRINAI